MQLPNAPLVEVVFELRWALEGADNIPVQLHQDPAYPILAHEFERLVRDHGFTEKVSTSPKEIGPLGPFGHSIESRFRKSADAPFPLWQIGPGIFACNESTDYEWSDFRELMSMGLTSLFASYPKTTAFDIKPIHLELRYVDAFNRDLLEHTDLQLFMNQNINIRLTLSEFLESDRFEGNLSGQIVLVKTLRDDIGSLRIEIGTGSITNTPSIVMVTKVIKTSEFIDLGKTTRSKISNVMKWADSAHDVTSPLFQDMISGELMTIFASQENT